MKVFHASSASTVLSIEGQGDDARAQVNFPARHQVVGTVGGEAHARELTPSAMQSQSSRQANELQIEPSASRPINAKAIATRPVLAWGWTCWALARATACWEPGVGTTLGASRPSRA
jgi:hypothetical protein